LGRFVGFDISVVLSLRLMRTMWTMCSRSPSPFRLAWTMMDSSGDRSRRVAPLKEKMDALGVESVLKYRGVKTPYRSPADFFIAKLIDK
jgi:hypothetical protein